MRKVLLPGYRLDRMVLHLVIEFLIEVPFAGGLPPHRRFYEP